MNEIETMQSRNIKLWVVECFRHGLRTEGNSEFFAAFIVLFAPVYTLSIEWLCEYE